MVRKTSRSTRAGFSLIELMIVVAIIAILAAVAIPQYQLYVLRAKQAEPATLMGTIKTAEYTNLAINDCFVQVAKTPANGVWPGGVPGVSAAPWVSNPTPGLISLCPPTATVFSFEDVGVRPTRDRVNYQYGCAARARIWGAVSDDFSCSAYGDIDGDSNFFEEIYCTDALHTGSCIPSPYGTVSNFPEDLLRVSPGIF